MRAFFAFEIEINVAPRMKRRRALEEKARFGFLQWPVEIHLNRDQLWLKLETSGRAMKTEVRLTHYPTPYPDRDLK